MKIIENNGNVVVVEVKFGVQVLFSYKTPVAAKIGGKLYRTEEFHSKTTSNHVNQFLDGREAEEKPQEWFDELDAEQ